MKRKITLLASVAASALAAALTALPAQAGLTSRECHGPSLDALNRIAEQNGAAFAGNVATNVNTNSGQGPAFGDPNDNTGEGVRIGFSKSDTLLSVDCNFFTSEDFNDDQSPQNPNLPPG